VKHNLWLSFQVGFRGGGW